MQKKQMVWKTKGMNQDLSVSAFNPEFAFENMNLRLSTNSGNTQLSWVNEKGTAEAGLVSIDMDSSKTPLAPDADGYTLRYKNYLYGHPVGTAVVGSKLIVFTHSTAAVATQGNALDFIYQLELNSDNTLGGKLLYKGNLGFSDEHPLETLVNYESEDIQKVYWTDGINQPRVINIAGDIKEDNDTQFDFLPAVGSGAISVSRSASNSGIFAPGVIQYCFTYYNKHGQQSNVVDTSSLHYISYSDRGASPEGKVSCSFTVTITNPDTNFDYVRLYSIQRTSLDAESFVRIVGDFSIPNAGSITYIDNGITGSAMDPMELLYIGGKEIKALTMTEKDGTLFMGNIIIADRGVSAIQAHFRNSAAVVNFAYDEDRTIPLDSSNTIYNHQFQLGNSLGQISTFKGGDKYRFGFQLQRNTGEWTEPIWIGDALNDKYPQYKDGHHSVKIVHAEATITLSGIDGLEVSDYKRVRPLVVYPNIADRVVLCQGVLNPTVFNVQDRIDNSPFAQASWFFRPYTSNSLRLYSDHVANAKKMVESLEKTGYDACVSTQYGVLSDTNLKKINVLQDSESYFEGKLKDVYVLVAEVDNDNIESIQKSGCLTAIYREESNRDGGVTRALAPKVNENNGEKRFEFDGIIALSDSTHSGNNTHTVTEGSKLYAFTKSTPWETAYGTAQAAGIDQRSLIYNNGVKRVWTASGAFKIYKHLRIGDSNKLYYLYNAFGVSSYIFRFYDTDQYYEVTFDNIYSAPSSNNENPAPVIKGSQRGDIIPFRHYDSLQCASKLNGDVNTSAAKQIEIQGSYAVYDSPFSATVNGKTGIITQSYLGVEYDVNDSALDSNTQFFVDQSIVTLNSPDLEFDTNVQTYDTEGLGLRIVGAIPITSCASAHHITTDSSMLENMHNLYLKGGGSIADNWIAASFNNTKDSIPSTFGAGELGINTNVPYNGNVLGAGRHLVAEYMWNDVVVANNANADDKIQSSSKFHDFLIHPWHRTGSLNNDYRKKKDAASLLKTKKMSNILCSYNSFYLDTASQPPATPQLVSTDIDCQIHLQENEQIINYRLKYGGKYINYYPNIDKVLYNKNGYIPYIKDSKDELLIMQEIATPISMKYKSGTHAILSLKKTGNTGIPILPYKTVNGTEIGKYSNPDPVTSPFWDTQNLSFSQSGNTNITMTNHTACDWLWLGELYKTTVPTNMFGGDTDSAIKANKWCVGGKAVDIPAASGNPPQVKVDLKWTYGDTYYQRYDCLKTYPFTNEDTNQMVEILSFMCETHVNLDSRYDRNRGQVDNTTMSPRNFNLLNPVYNQQDNFFTYKQVDEGESRAYPNQLCFTGTKNSGADVDEWTHITLGGVLELDGDKGQLTSLQRLNNNIIAFQEKGISRILYNENAAISTTAGVPIELGNSGKVQGKQYISNTIGCSNKWSICNTPNGIYFMDSNEKSIYLFNGQLENLSIKGGMNSWCKKNIGAGLVWNPVNFGVSDGKSGFVSYYDRENQDVLFVNKDTALAWSEKFGTFTSFYDYGGGSYFNSLQDIGVWTVPGEYIVDNEGVETTVCGDSTLFYLHNKGNYGVFFGSRKPYWMTLVGNPEPLRDKTFTNLEFRACIEGEGQTLNTGNYALHPTYKHFLPFNEIECWDEYQHGMATLQDKDGHDVMKHFLQDNTAHLNRKFRIWRCDVPRDNVEIQSNMPIEPTGNPNATVKETYRKAKAKYDNYVKEQEMGVYRFAAKPLDRIRNPWMYLKLAKNIKEGEDLPKAEIHDVIMSYFV